MRTIHKYEIKTTDKQTIDIPELLSLRGNYIESFRNQIIKIDEQHGKVFMWVIVNDDYRSRPVNIYIRGTGHACEPVGECDPNYNIFDKEHYLGTYQLYDGDFVGHVFCE